MLRQPTTRYRYERILKASPTSTTILVRDPTGHLLVLKRGVTVPQECRLLQKFENSEHIVRLVEGPFEDDLGRSCMLVEYCDGGDLGQWIGREAGEERQRAAPELMLQLAMALDRIHSCNILHRDLKPKNIFIAHRPHKMCLKIGDFGVSKETDLAETALGTPLYLSPEMVRGLPYSGASDVWALGCVMWEVVTGEPPFAKRSLRELMHAICKTEPVGLVNMAGVQPLVMGLIKECLRKEAKERPTAAAIIERLKPAKPAGLSRDQAISLLQSKFGDTMCSHILSSIATRSDDDDHEGRFERILRETTVDPPKSQSALIHRIVKLRRDLAQSVFMHDDDKLDLAVHLIQRGTTLSELAGAVGLDCCSKLMADDCQLGLLKELSVLQGS